MSRKLSPVAAAALAVLVTACAAASAGPLDHRVVPARAGAVMHIDITAVKSSKLRRRLGPKIPTVAKIKQMLASSIHGAPFPIDTALNAVLGATGLTIWVDSAGDHGALIVEGIDGPALTLMARAAPGVKTHTHAGTTIYTFGKGGDDASVAIVGNRAIVSTTQNGVVATLDALAGKGRARLAPALQSAVAGKLFFVAVLDRRILTHVQKQASSSLLKSGTLTRLALAVGERGDDLFVTARATTATAKDAGQIQRVADGMLALAQLAVHQPELQKILGATSLNRAGTLLTIDVKLPVDEVVNLIDSAGK